jgi:hypothetical protein
VKNPYYTGCPGCTCDPTDLSNMKDNCPIHDEGPF